ncbi:MAG: transketolase family protein [Acidobacteria bacterium]|nr:MAG: transketolase family protein [Acidobacteriota bacterium]
MMSELNDCTDAFVGALAELAASDERVFAVTNDSLGAAKLAGFRKRFPDRLIQVGPAEKDMIGIAAALAKDGRLPFVCGESYFTARQLEQIHADLGCSQPNLKICRVGSDRAGGRRDAPRHSSDDPAWARVVDDLCVIVPADPLETEQAVRRIAAYDGPVYLSLSRRPVPIVHRFDYGFEIGRAAILRDGTDLTLISSGSRVSWTLGAAEALAGDGIEARVLNMSTIRPLDSVAIERAARETGAIITVEDYSVFGRLGGAVAQVVLHKHPVPVRLLDVPGALAPSGSAPWLLDCFGLTVSAIRNAALDLLEVTEKRRD